MAAESLKGAGELERRTKREQLGKMLTAVTKSRYRCLR